MKKGVFDLESMLASPAFADLPETGDHDCGECRDAGWIITGGAGVTPCDCRREQILNTKLGAIPRALRSCTFKSYLPKTKTQRSGLEAILANLNGSFLLTGQYGVGKTHLLVAQYRALLKCQTRTIFRGSADLMAELETEAMDRDYRAPVFDLREGDHFFWDDADKFKLTEFKSEALFKMVDHLWRHQVGLSVTSNLQLAGLSVKIGPATAHRVLRLCTELEIR